MILKVFPKGGFARDILVDGAVARVRSTLRQHVVVFDLLSCKRLLWGVCSKVCLYLSPFITVLVSCKWSYYAVYRAPVE